MPDTTQAQDSLVPEALDITGEPRPDLVEWFEILSIIRKRVQTPYLTVSGVLKVAILRGILKELLRLKELSKEGIRKSLKHHYKGRFIQSDFDPVFDHNWAVVCTCVRDGVPNAVLDKFRDKFAMELEMSRSK